MIGIALSFMWGRLQRALGTTLGAFTRWPRECAIVLLIALSAWLWRGWGHERAGRKDDAARVAAAQAEAGRIAREALAHQEAQYREKALVADKRYAQSLADAQSRTAAYIANHRLRADGSRVASPALASAESAGAGSPERTDPQALVAVTADDVEVCTTNTLRLEEARAWALGL